MFWCSAHVVLWCSTGSDKSMAPAPKLFTAIFEGLPPTVSKQQEQENTKNMLTRADCPHSLKTKKIYTQRKNGKEKNSSSPPTNPLESDPPTPSSIWITCSLLKGPSPGRSGGGDTPNEDEYSAAFERLLEGCPARTRCSSQIDGTVRVEGGARRAGLKWRSWMVGAGGGVGGWSGDDWGGRQTEEACVPVCPSGKWAESNACLHTHTCGNRHSTAQESQEWGRRLLTYCGK